MVEGIKQTPIPSESSQLDHPDSGPCNSQILRRSTTVGRRVHSTVRHGHPTDTSESVEAPTWIPGSCFLGWPRSWVTSIPKLQVNHHQRRNRSVASVHSIRWWPHFEWSMGHAEYSELPGRDVQRKLLSTETLVLNGLLVWTRWHSSGWPRLDRSSPTTEQISDDGTSPTTRHLRREYHRFTNDHLRRS